MGCKEFGRGIKKVYGFSTGVLGGLACFGIWVLRDWILHRWLGKSFHYCGHIWKGLLVTLPPVDSNTLPVYKQFVEGIERRLPDLLTCDQDRISGLNGVSRNADIGASSV